MVHALEQVETAGRGDLRIAPLSYGQEGLWLLQHLYPGNSALNLFRALRTAKPLVPSALALSISEIVRRHEILRTNFRIIDGRPMQVIRPPNQCPSGSSILVICCRLSARLDWSVGCEREHLSHLSLRTMTYYGLILFT